MFGYPIVEPQLASLVQVLWVLVFLIGLLVFMVFAVLCAEFLRRERTKTQDDDWMNFGKS